MKKIFACCLTIFIVTLFFITCGNNPLSSSVSPTGSTLAQQPEDSSPAVPSTPVQSSTPEVVDTSPEPPSPKLKPINVTPISCDGESCFAIKKDGRLLAWGRNDSAALGGGREVYSYEKPNELMTSVKYVSGGQWVTLIIDAEDTLWGIGNDSFGLLGNITENPFPYQLVKLMDNVICASTSSLHCLAVTDDGSLWFWGTGQIPGDEPQPVSIGEERREKVKIMDDVIFAQAAGAGGYAIKSDYSLWEWGIVSPDLVKIMDDVVCVKNRVALKKNSDVVEWYYGPEGQVLIESKPILHDVSSMDHGSAVKNDGSLWVWGSNEFGQLGDGTNRSPDTPKKIMDNVAYVSRGIFYTLIVKTDGTLWQSGSMEGFKKEYAKPYKIGEDIWLPEE